jgi:hypothetical protein
LGELFVREGEPEPPPHSRLIILVDTEVDRSLFKIDEGRIAVDMLCEAALAAALEYQARGMDISIGYTGGRMVGGKDDSEGNLSAPMNAEALASALALPFSIFRGGRRPGNLMEAELPVIPKNTALLILALPRTFIEISVPAAEPKGRGSPPVLSALEKFLKKRDTKQEADIVFLYNVDNRKAGELEDAARSCVKHYNARTGIHASKAAIFPGRYEEGK